MVFHIATLSQLASGLQSLPPMLNRINLDPMTRYSKASRGLSVLLRVNGIFTDNASSSGYSLRQSPTRYAIRAGRNLHDKEFRSKCYFVTPQTYADSTRNYADRLFLSISLCRHRGRTIFSPPPLKIKRRLGGVMK